MVRNSQNRNHPTGWCLVLCEYGLLDKGNWVCYYQNWVIDMFETYFSNTVAGSGNQHFFVLDKSKSQTGRVFYKITAAGEYNYSVMFSNIIDSTFADGAQSHKNLVCKSWKILEAKVCACDKTIIPNNFTKDAVANAINSTAFDFTSLTFGGNTHKEVAPGELFFSDPVRLNFEKGDYFCLEITFSGEMIPYHEETLLPVFVKGEAGWSYSRLMPFAGMIGCDRPITEQIGFIGDSITQGCGTPFNAYTHWCAVFADMFGENYAYWNLGLGYGRADDMASDGAWAFKAKQNDTLFVCYGVNDINQGFSEKQIINNLTRIVDILKKENKRVILQTIPPFNYEEDKIAIWKNVNSYIKNELAKKVDFVFDVVPVLQKSGEGPHMARFGPHPDEEGCRLWAEKLYEEIIKFNII